MNPTPHGPLLYIALSIAAGALVGVMLGALVRLFILA